MTYNSTKDASQCNECFTTINYVFVPLSISFCEYFIKVKYMFTGSQEFLFDTKNYKFIIDYLWSSPFFPNDLLLHVYQHKPTS